MDAPVAVKLAADPAQIDGVLDARLITGVGFTSRETVLLVKHPNALSPVTEYTVVDAGLTARLDDTVPEGLQVWLTPPDTVKVDPKPGQIAVGVAFTTRAGP